MVIPLAVRKDMKLPVGAEFEVVRQNEDILLRRDRVKEGLSFEEAMARLDEISKPYRPKVPLPVEVISEVSEEALRAHYQKKYP